jgi:hypothetical protein
MTTAIDTSVCVPEPIDLALLTRRALREARARTYLTVHEVADMLTLEPCTDRHFSAAKVLATETGRALFVDAHLFLLGLRLAGLDLIETIESWTRDPRATAIRPAERPYGHQGFPAAWAGLLSARPHRDLDEIIRRALAVGRERSKASPTGVARELNAVLGGRLQRTRATVIRMETTGALFAPDVLAALRAYGLDLVGPVERWVASGRVAR